MYFNLRNPIQWNRIVDNNFYATYNEEDSICILNACIKICNVSYRFKTLYATTGHWFDFDIRFETPVFDVELHVVLKYY